MLPTNPPNKIVPNNSPKAFQARMMKIAIVAVMSMALIGVAIGWVQGQSWASILSFIQFIAIFGAALILFLWWVQQARTPQYDPATRKHLLRRSVIAIAVTGIIGGVVELIWHNSNWTFIALMVAGVGSNFWMGRK